MNHELLSTDEDRLARLVAGAFEALPPPETARLAAVESRLARTLPSGKRMARAPGWYWWLIGALAVSGAAAWWAGSYLLVERADEPVEQHESVAADPPARNGSTGSTPGQGGERRDGVAPGTSDDGTTIFRRERY